MALVAKYHEWRAAPTDREKIVAGSFVARRRPAIKIAADLGGKKALGDRQNRIARGIWIAISS